MIIHAFVTFLAGLVLVIAPEAIPHMVSVSVSKNQYILCYFVAASEFSIAYLSFQTTKVKDLIIVFHLITAVLEVFVLQNGESKVLILNIVLRIIISFLCYVFGILRLRAGK